MYRPILFYFISFLHFIIFNNKNEHIECFGFLQSVSNDENTRLELAMLREI